MPVSSILDVIGNVPMVILRRISSGKVFAKAEFLNPGGSIKDRVAKFILEKAVEEGRLRPGMVVIEATSGNTGIGLCLAGVQSGFAVICVMPDNVSEERKRIIEALGGETILIPARENLSGCVKKMQEIASREPEKYFVVTSFKIRIIPGRIFCKPGRESGKTQAERSISLWPALAVVAPCKEWGNI